MEHSDNNPSSGKPVVLSAQGVGKHFKIYTDKPLTLKDRTFAFIKKSYELFWALKSVDLDIHKGETVGLIGHNGCGKSTLLKLFTRIIYPDKGEINVKGQVSSLLELGAGFHPDFTGRENIYTNASIFGFSRAQTDSRIDSIIEFSELGAFIDNPVRTYSSGMYMRLAFSVAIHVDPQILLIDEVLAVGDANFQKKCLERIAAFKRQDVTIVMVSHDLATIERICDRVVWLEDGIIQADGPPKPVVTAYLAHMMEAEDRQFQKEHPSETGSKEVESAEESKTEKNTENRWGDKRGEIISVKLLDKNGLERGVFDTEDSMTIAVEVLVREKLPSLACGIGIFGADGICRYGTNTDLDGLEDISRTFSLEESSGEVKGTVRCKIERLGLMPGSYRLDTALHDVEGMPYDYILGVKEFGIASPLRDIGMARPPHSWQAEAGK